MKKKRPISDSSVPLSENMLAHAREKAKSSNAPSSLAFVHEYASTVNINQKFDTALMMFAVLGYQLANEDMLAALNTVCKHLNPGGVFIFDIRYGPRGSGCSSSDRVKVIPQYHEGVRILPK